MKFRLIEDIAPGASSPTPCSCANARACGYEALPSSLRRHAEWRLRRRNGGSVGFSLKEIKSKLANLVPKNFDEVYDLFDFAVAATLEKVSTLENAQTEIKMLNALRRGIFSCPNQRVGTPHG